MNNNMEAFINDYNVLIKTSVIDNEYNQIYQLSIRMLSSPREQQIVKFPQGNCLN